MGPISQLGPMDSIWGLCWGLLDPALHSQSWPTWGMSHVAVLGLCMLIQHTAEGLAPVSETKFPKKRKTLQKVGRLRGGPHLSLTLTSDNDTNKGQPFTHQAKFFRQDKVMKCGRGSALLYIYLIRAQKFPYLCTQTRRLEKRGFLGSFFPLSSFMHWCIVHLFWVFPILYYSQRMHRRVGKRKFWWLELEKEPVSSHKRFEGRISSPKWDGLSERVLRWVQWAGCNCFEGNSWFAHSYLWDGAISPSGICLHGVL